MSHTLSDPSLGWELYFPFEEFDPKGPIVECVSIFIQYLSGENGAFLFQPTFLRTLEQTHTVHLDYQRVRDDIQMMKDGFDFEKNLQEFGETVINCLGLALFQLVAGRTEVQGIIQNSNKINVRLYNFEPITPLKCLKSNALGRLVSIRGTVIRVSNIKPYVIKLDFMCTKCQQLVTQYFREGRYQLPTKCPTPQCRNKTFQPERSSALTVDWQKIRIQEQMSDDQRESGRIPRTIECELTEDLVDTCVPGDVVTVTGLVKVISAESMLGKTKSKNKGMFSIYLDVNSIDNPKQLESAKLELMTFEAKDLYMIQEICSQKNLFRLIVNSLAPGIYGHELVKAGLGLALFGGCRKYIGDMDDKVSIRGDVHVLVVGDPGLGKSQMLQAVSNVAPRGVFVCGSNSTSSGLTVTVIKESKTGDFALEAGALVLADQGACCIDEFDKMTHEYQSLLETMEQQSVSIAKAGIIANLPARTSVIAAANPNGGHYNRAKTVAENLKIGAPLLSRFDLIYILLDKPDQEMDKFLSEHVMSLHSGRKKPRLEYSYQDEPPSQGENVSIQSILRVPRGEPFDPIPPLLLRKYIAYAKKYVQPKMTIEASKVLQDFYLELRRKHSSVDSTPITTRQLESLVRLSEARAKLELREEVTEDDALQVVEIMKETLFDSYEDQFGNIDFRRSSGMSKAKETKRMLSALQRRPENVFTVQELQNIAEQIGIRVDNFNSFIDTLNQQGYLLKKAPRTYALTI